MEAEVLKKGPISYLINSFTSSASGSSSTETASSASSSASASPRSGSRESTMAVSSPSSSSSSKSSVVFPPALAASMDTIIDSIVATDQDGIVLYVNGSAEFMFGYPKSFLLGKNVKLLMPEPYRSSHDSFMRRYRETKEGKVLGSIRTFQGERNGGMVFNMDISLGFAPFPGGSNPANPVFLATIREVPMSTDGESSLEGDLPLADKGSFGGSSSIRSDRGEPLASSNASSPSVSGSSISNSSSSSSRRPEYSLEGIASDDSFLELAKLLQKNALESLIPVFQAEEVDYDAFFLLKEENLKEMGIKTGSRVKILAMINDQPRPSTIGKKQGSITSSKATTNSEETLSEISSSSMTTLIPTDEIVLHEVIGRGSYGLVYRGLWLNRPVAVKKILSSSENEAKLLSKVRHRNIVQCFGMLQEAGDTCLVMELGKSNLKNVIHDPEFTIDIKTTISWALQVAKGMNYLHSEGVEKILHRDLKPGNVIVFEGGLLKITDFGLSKVHHDVTEKMSAVGTFEYMAPEVIRSLPYSDKADVYSYGVLVWEILTRQIPYKNLSPLSVAFGVGSGSLSLPIPKDCPPFDGLLEQCLQREYAKRPNFKSICSSLEALARSDNPDARTYSDYQEMQKNWQKEIFEVFSRFQEIGNPTTEMPSIEREKIANEKETTCFHTRKNYHEDVLGLGIIAKRSEVNPADINISYISPYFLSASSFFDGKIRRYSAKERDDYTHWLPLCISESHQDRMNEYLNSAIISIATGSPQSKNCPTPPPHDAALTVITSCFEFIFHSIFLQPSQKSFSKALKGFYAFHWLLHFLVERDQSLAKRCQDLTDEFFDKGFSAEQISSKELEAKGKYIEMFLMYTMLPSFFWKDKEVRFLEEILQLCWGLTALLQPTLLNFVTVTKGENKTEATLQGIDDKKFLLLVYSSFSPNLRTLTILSIFSKTIASFNETGTQGFFKDLPRTLGRPTKKASEEFESTCWKGFMINNMTDFLQYHGLFSNFLSPTEFVLKAFVAAQEKGFFDRIKENPDQFVLNLKQ